MNEGSRAMTMFFLKIATVTLTLAYHNYWSNPESELKLEFDQDIFHTKHLCEVTAKSVYK